jgi:hypothetical protein
MNDFLHEIWYDLRAKRLWPVAILLAVALVAVPVVMLKPAVSADAGGDVAATPVQARTAKDLLPVEVLDDQGKGSKLDSFDAKNPFKSLLKKMGGSTALADVAKSVDSSPAPGPDRGATRGGSSGGSTGGGGGGVTSPPPAPPTRRVQRYTYVLDVTFVNRGRVSRIRGLRKLDMLPSQSNPLLLFVGVDAEADDAVFLVDSSLKANGEGSCKPSGSQCGVVAIGPGSEHYFTDEDGNTYELRVDEIRKVTLAAARRSAAARTKAGASSNGSFRRFSSPFLTDGENVATTGPDR